MGLWRAAEPVVVGDEDHDLRRSRRCDLAVERLGGEATLLAVEIDDWLAEIWSGRNRACTLLLLSTALAGAAILARRAGWPEGDGSPPEA